MCAPVPHITQPPACVGQAAKQRNMRFTLADVAQHSTPGDCWLIVRGKVYDVTGWAAQHPGGNMIFVKAGGECTQLFDSYHPLSARCAMPDQALAFTQATSIPRCVSCLPTRWCAPHDGVSKNMLPQPPRLGCSAAWCQYAFSAGTLICRMHGAQACAGEVLHRQPGRA